MKNRSGSQRRDRSESTGKLIQFSVVRREKPVSLPRTWKTSCAELGLSHHLWGVLIMSRQGRKGEVWIKIEGNGDRGEWELEKINMWAVQWEDMSSFYSSTDLPVAVQEVTTGKCLLSKERSSSSFDLDSWEKKRRTFNLQWSFF